MIRYARETNAEGLQCTHRLAALGVFLRLPPDLIAAIMALMPPPLLPPLEAELVLLPPLGASLIVALGMRTKR